MSFTIPPVLNRAQAALNRVINANWSEVTVAAVRNAAHQSNDSGDPVL